MLLRYFYDEKLAHASYLVGCQACGDAIVIDPSRDIEQYLRTAKAEGVKITAATETHIHADFVSGARELAMQTNAKLYLSGEGGDEWRHDYAKNVSHHLIGDGDTFFIGNIKFEVMHTPGHTPESVSFIITDTKTSDRPMGIFSGDFVFVGDVGRPDLLEKAVGVKGSANDGAKQMFASLQRFKKLPDYLQLWPAHGAGSACGKALGAVPSSTVGYEKMVNWALAYTDETPFVQALLEGQSDPPLYFAVMKRVNKTGPTLLSELPKVVSLSAAATEMEQLLKQGAQLIDTRTANEFAKSHLVGTINIPFNKSFVSWAGWLVDYDRPLYLLLAPSTVESVLHDLRSIGIDNVNGYVDIKVIEDFQNAGTTLSAYLEIGPEDASVQIQSGQVHVLDVRNPAEWDEGHIHQAQHIPLGRLFERMSEVPKDKPILVHCRSGARSAIAASMLKAKGFKHVINLSGGYDAWVNKGFDRTMVTGK